MSLRDPKTSQSHWMQTGAWVFKGEAELANEEVSLFIGHAALVRVRGVSVPGWGPSLTRGVTHEVIFY